MANRQIDISIRRYLEFLIYNNIQISSAILFGSFATGESDEDSDIDLAVISPDFGHDRFNESVMLKKLTLGIDPDISPRPYSDKQYQDAKQGDFLFDEIIQKGRIIYDI